MPAVHPDIMQVLDRTIHCLERIHVLNSLTIADEMPELQIGVGINRGPVSTGYLGGLGRCHLAFLGNTTNVVSRIESLTKELPGTVLASEDCFSQAEPDFWRNPFQINFTCRDVGNHPMKNIKKPPKLFSFNPLLRGWIIRCGQLVENCVDSIAINRCYQPGR